MADEKQDGGVESCTLWKLGCKTGQEKNKYNLVKVLSLEYISRVVQV